MARVSAHELRGDWIHHLRGNFERWRTVFCVIHIYLRVLLVQCRSLQLGFFDAQPNPREKGCCSSFD